MTQYCFIERGAACLVLFSLLTLFGCGAGITVQVDYDKKANFEGLRSFSFKEGNDSSAVERRVQQAIRTELSVKGYNEQTGGGSADFQVASHAALQKKTIWQREFSPRGIPAGVVPITFNEGTIAVQIITPKTGKVIWTGRAEEAVSNQAQALSEIQPEVKKILARFPPR